jgi:ribosome biogenesis GTPase / thiamine phosphate phosphatase
MNIRNNSFVCRNCKKDVAYSASGTKNRNHCPYCLYSLHVDNEIGDRASVCGGLMPAIGKMYKPDGEEVLVHKCEVCGLVRKNRIAGDDDWDLVAGLAVLENL